MLTNKTLRHIFIVSLIIAVISPLINLFSTDLFKNSETILSTLFIFVSSSVMLILITLLLFKLDKNIANLKNTEKFLRDSQELLISEHKKLKDVLRQVDIAKKEWEKTMDCVRDMIILSDNEGNIRRCNKSFMEFSGMSYKEVIGKEWGKLLQKAGFESSTFFGESIELLHRPSHRWYRLKSYPFNDTALSFSGNVITIQDITELKQISEEIDMKNKELEKAYSELKASQSKILQQEKMASIGQLAAGVAHEINNPMGFISSNIGTFGKYIDKLIELINAQSEIIKAFNSLEYSNVVKEKREMLKIDYIIKDIKDLIKESLGGTERVKKIVQNLKSFSRIDEADYKHADINECMESTLNIAWNEIKYKAKVIKEYGDMPLTKCYPQQLNQVFLNLLLNAVQSIEKQGIISIKTWSNNGSIMVSVADTGCGIPQENLDRIFEPFFTTKEVGKGTGLGLSITYDIMKKHKGDITVESEIGKGTIFTVKIPIVEGK